MRVLLLRYWVIFASIYAGAMLLANVVGHGFNIDLGFLNGVMLFVAVSAVAWIIIISITTLLYYFSLNLTYGWAARKYAQKALVKNAT